MVLTSHGPWTTTAVICSLDMNWIVAEALLCLSKSAKTKSLSLSASSLSNSSYSDSTSSSSLDSSSVIAASLLMSVIVTSNSLHFVKLPTDGSQTMLVKIQVKFSYSQLFHFATLNEDVPFKSLYVRSAPCFLCSSAALVLMSFLISISFKWLTYVITCFSTLYAEALSWWYLDRI